MGRQIAPLQIDVFNKNFQSIGSIGDPKFVTVTLRYNAVGTTTVSISAQHRMVQKIVDEGARLRIRDEKGSHLMSGWIERLRGVGPTGSGFIEIDIRDDLAVLGELLGWVLPAAAITAQGSAGDNWVLTDNAETVLKAAVTANATRAGMPLTCATDLGRGSVITGKLRFHPIFDRLFPVVDGAGLEAAGIGVTVKQVGASLVLDVFEPNVYPRDLTEAGGAIVDYSYTLAGPTATRVVVGGQGEAQARVFRNYVDATRETLYGRKIERFRDARDVDDVADLPARGQETLDDGAPKSGIAITLSQTDNLRYGKSINIGDQATMRVGNATITDVVREVVLSWTRDAGWKVTPKVGERTDDPDTMFAVALRRMARWISNQTRT